MRMTATANECTAPRPLRDRRIKFHPRLDILDEVVAGLLWIQLDLPADATRQEIEHFACHLVARIRGEASEATIEGELAALQSVRFGRPVNRANIRDLVRRAMRAVRSA